MSFDPVVILTERFERAIAGAFGSSLGTQAIDAAIAPSKNPKFGDFQCNAAMALGKQLGKPPRELALAIARTARIDDIAEPLNDANVAGPGFINITLKPEALGRLVETMDGPTLGVEPEGKGHTLVVDLCGVNLAKQMHVGHIRATFIGDALARTFERLGYRVIRQNHVGDWGLNIAMVVSKLMELEAGGRDVGSLNLDAIERLYKDAQRECDADEKGLAAARRFNLGPKAEAELTAQVEGARAAMGRAKQTLVRLQTHEPGVHAVWKRVADVTMRECLSICARMNANVTSQSTAGESSYADELAPMVDDLVRRGVALEDDGALVIRVEGVEEPCLIRKSDGGFLYATTDICAIRRRVQKLGGERVVYCVDARQSLHFKQVFGAARAAGFAKISGGEARLEHAAFGTILGEDGRPFKTRSGESVRLADLIDEAIDRAAKAVREKNPDLPDAERQRVAEAVGIAALKYADLSNDRVKDYVFSFDRMLAFEGNTGPYLLYALVRIKSIFRKAAEAGVTPPDASTPIRIVSSEEKSLALALLRFPGVVRSVADSLEPHRLCQYLYDLAGAYSSFFTNCPVLQASDEATRASRLRLCKVCERVLEDGLTMLGVRVIERM